MFLPFGWHGCSAARAGVLTIWLAWMQCCAGALERVFLPFGWHGCSAARVHLSRRAYRECEFPYNSRVLRGSGRTCTKPVKNRMICAFVRPLQGGKNQKKRAFTGRPSHKQTNKQTNQYNSSTQTSKQTKTKQTNQTKPNQTKPSQANPTNKKQVKQINQNNQNKQLHTYKKHTTRTNNQRNKTNKNQTKSNQTRPKRNERDKQTHWHAHAHTHTHTSSSPLALTHFADFCPKRFHQARHAALPPLLTRSSAMAPLAYKFVSSTSCSWRRVDQS